MKIENLLSLAGESVIKENGALRRRITALEREVVSLKKKTSPGVFFSIDAESIAILYWRIVKHVFDSSSPRMTFAEIASMMGCSNELARQKEMKAFRSMRESAQIYEKLLKEKSRYILPKTEDCNKTENSDETN